MMAGMPELSRRAILRLGVGAAAGAAGAYSLGSALHTQGASVTGPPVSMTNAGAPLAPPPLEPAPAAVQPTYVDGSFVSAARGGVATNWAIAIIAVAQIYCRSRAYGIFAATRAAVPS